METEAAEQKLTDLFKDYKPPIAGEIVECRKCGRRLLVERVLMGTDHTMAIHIICWDCLDDGGEEKVKEFYHFNKIESGVRGVH